MKNKIMKLLSYMKILLICGLLDATGRVFVYYYPGTMFDGSKSSNDILGGTFIEGLVFVVLLFMWLYIPALYNILVYIRKYNANYVKSIFTGSIIGSIWYIFISILTYDIYHNWWLGLVQLYALVGGVMGYLCWRLVRKRMII